jgi:hypothetical protein
MRVRVPLGVFRCDVRVLRAGLLERDFHSALDDDGPSRAIRSDTETHLNIFNPRSDTAQPRPAAQLELADRACWYAPSAIVLRLSFDGLGVVECGETTLP